MKELLEYIIKHIVDLPDKVAVKEIIGVHTIIYELQVADADMGKVIGKSGKNVDSIRTILSAAAASQRKRVILEVLENKERKRILTEENRIKQQSIHDYSAH